MDNSRAAADHSPPGLADRIAPHLPLLRRYARAVTGSQRSGDACVAALLEAILADRSTLPANMAPRVALYAAFQRLWRSIDMGEASAAEAPVAPEDLRERRAADRLARVTPTGRQALLLTAVEGFATAEAATVMGLPEAETAALVEAATDELRRQTRARVLIIEDEPIIAMDIEQIVRDLGHEVTAIEDTRDRAVAAARRDPPDLVLADIQLADGSSGIDAAADIIADGTPPVIFITAFPERLLTGERPEPAFLIAKPFRTRALETSITQALFFSGADAAAAKG